MNKISKEELNKIVKSMGQITTNGDGTYNEDIGDMIVGLLAMPDEQFDILAPGVTESFSQVLNNSNDKLMLVQALNAEGTYVEDLIKSMEPIMEEIETLDLSRTKKDFLKRLIGEILNSIEQTEGIAKRIISIPIELCNENAKLPAYAHLSDSGMDIYALEDITIKPGETKLIPTGIKVALPAGFELQVRPKSGRCLKTKLRVANTPGTIDAGYRDEIGIIIDNIDPPIKSFVGVTEDGQPVFEFGSSYTIGKGEKFCQLVLQEVPKASFYRVDSVNDLGENRGGGFGSTGLK